MVVRKRRKLNKLRGNRRHGHGNTKNRRGSGVRGGVGRGGSHKHKFTKYYVDFGTIRTLKKKPRTRGINLDDFQDKFAEWIEKKLIEKKGDTYYVDGSKIGYGKLLSRGSINEKIFVRKIQASAKALDKIERAGGKIEVVGKWTEGVEEITEIEGDDK